MKAESILRFFGEVALWKIRIQMFSAYKEIRSKLFCKHKFILEILYFSSEKFINFQILSTFKYWTFMSTWIPHLRDIKNVNACDPQYAKSRMKRQPKVVSEPSCSFINGDPSGVEPSFQKLCKKSILNPIFQFLYYQIPIFR